VNISTSKLTIIIHVEIQEVRTRMGKQKHTL